MKSTVALLTLCVILCVVTLPCFASESIIASMPLSHRTTLANVIVIAKVMSISDDTASPDTKEKGELSPVTIRLQVSEVVFGDEELQTISVYATQRGSAHIHVDQEAIWLLGYRTTTKGLLLPASNFVVPTTMLPDVRAALNAKPLSIYLQPSSLQCTLPASIDLTVTLSNRGEADIVILDPHAPRPAVVEDVAADASDESDKEDGEKKAELAYVEFGSRRTIESRTIAAPLAVMPFNFAPRDGQRPAEVTLKQNTSHTVTFNISEQFNYAVKAPGRVYVRYVYQTTGAQEGLPTHWHGTAASNRVWINVTDKKE